ncbi:N-acetylmuramoyl-L-alanine amidase [Sphingomonas sp. NSE70-1]|uniref:N-acetylmuramoyl-L-alanine amidase n=1 Tax=Sphingomonas caseinilyticus TaxID=2908205 RepID=A0ABT0RXS6_9SPHN|nr:N-acetylmuramoyl-L-alanine amidase [Sphingomonas caseinilyticus]MCL6699797.1 N-acetylmuramoyl-L-alanine amidase [Sphingomonas caseinilyticus]
MCLAHWRRYRNLNMVERRRTIGLAVGAAVLAAVGLLVIAAGRERTGTVSDALAMAGEARTGHVTLDMPEAISDVRVREARLPGRPIVLIDPGHGGRDPGAPGVSGTSQEKQLTLAMASELADLLEERGRVRVALTREDDRYLTLEQRAGIARKLQAGLFLSLHMDSAPNPLARGATIYSLSDVASSAEAARFAQAENGSDGALSTETDDSVRALLADVALREQMEASAGLAERLLRRASGRLELRPRPHQFAAFHVLRRAETPAVLIEAGYISNADDEARLMTKEGRAPLVLALAQAVEADLALRNQR